MKKRQFDTRAGYCQGLLLLKWSLYVAKESDPRGAVREVYSFPSLPMKIAVPNFFTPNFTSRSTKY